MTNSGEYKRIHSNFQYTLLHRLMRWYNNTLKMESLRKAASLLPVKDGLLTKRSRSKSPPAMLVALGMGSDT